MSTVTMNENENKQGKLTPEFIADLLAGSRQRNQYGPKLVEFFNSDEPAVNPAEAWPTEFANKVPGTLYQGFINALKKAGDEVKDQVIVIKRDDSVFILHKERAHVATQPTENAE